MELTRKVYLLIFLLVVSAALGMEARADDPAQLNLMPVRIEFIRPNSTCVYYQGETMSIRFRLARLPGASIPRGATAVKLAIYDAGGRLYHVPSVPFTEGHPLVASFWIPNNFRPGRAIITANLTDGHGLVLTREIGRTGFRVYENHSYLIVNVGGLIEGHHVLEVGERVQVEYTTLTRLPPCKITFTLKRRNSNRTLSSVVRDYRPGAPDQRRQVYSFVIPYTIREAGEYQVNWTSTPPVFRAGEQRFSVVQPRNTLVPPLGSARWSIEIISPRAGVIGFWSGGTVRGIAWRLRGQFPEPRSFSVALEDRQGHKVLDIPTRGRVTWRPSDATCILSWQVPEGLDGAYRIRVTEVNSGVTARSAVFSIRGTGEPFLRFTSPGNGLVVHNNQTVPIRWEARNFPHRGSRREPTVTISLVTPDREIRPLVFNVPVYRQSFLWTVDANRRPVDFRGSNQLVGESPGFSRGRMGGVFYPAGEYRLVMECSAYGIRIEGPRFRIQ